MSEEEWVILSRLDATQGFFDMGDALRIAGELQDQGFNVIAETAPGALMDTPGAFFLKVPLSQFSPAKEALAKILEK